MRIIVGAGTMGVPHLVRSVVNGRPCSPGKVAGAVTDVGLLLADPALRTRLGRGGRVIAEVHPLTRTVQTFERRCGALVGPAGLR